MGKIKVKILKNQQYVLGAIICLIVTAALLIIVRFIQYKTYCVQLESCLSAEKDSADMKRGQPKKDLDKFAAGYEKTVKELQKRNLFAIVRSSTPTPPVCTGILGDKAIINGRLLAVGDTLDQAKVVSIGAKDVTILFMDKETKLVPFAVNNVAKISSRGPQKETKVAKGKNVSGIEKSVSTAQGSAMGSGQSSIIKRSMGNFFNMSEQDRRAMIEKFRNMSPEERRKFAEKQGIMFGGRGNRGSRGGAPGMSGFSGRRSR